MKRAEDLLEDFSSKLGDALQRSGLGGSQKKALECWAFQRFVGRLFPAHTTSRLMSAVDKELFSQGADAVARLARDVEQLLDDHFDPLKWLHRLGHNLIKDPDFVPQSFDECLTLSLLQYYGATSYLPVVIRSRLPVALESADATEISRQLASFSRSLFDRFYEDYFIQNLGRYALKERLPPSLDDPLVMEATVEHCVRHLNNTRHLYYSPVARHIEELKSLSCLTDDLDARQSALMVLGLLEGQSPPGHPGSADDYAGKAFLGGAVSNEVIKILTGRNKPAQRVHFGSLSKLAFGEAPSSWPDTC